MTKDDKSDPATEIAIKVKTVPLGRLGRDFIDTMEGTKDEKVTRAVVAILAALGAPVLFPVLSLAAHRTMENAKRVAVHVVYNNGETHIYSESGTERWRADDEGNPVRLDKPPTVQ